ncbi:hypothetical protein HDV00_007156 [Rhizophlyctis rosea]|nr:hypothetical protein HDV00_007156 [Rhizophlyctis rosea]
MRILAIFAILAACISATFAALCKTGPTSDMQQRAAFQSFVNTLYVQKKVKQAFDDWIPGQYIQHHPSTSQGRDAAIAALSPLFAIPSLQVTVAGQVVGQGFAVLHYRMKVPGAFDMAVMDRFRFDGTCIVEHWDVGQSIPANDTNPVAFF